MTRMTAIATPPETTEKKELTRYLRDIAHLHQHYLDWLDDFQKQREADRVELRKLLNPASRSPR